MESLILSNMGYAMVVIAAVVGGLWAVMSINRLPPLLRTEISRRIEHSIVVEHDTEMGKH